MGAGSDPEVYLDSNLELVKIGYDGKTVTSRVVDR